jgi:hypothetical protein
VIESSERRLHELGAVLRVVQEEAEQAFVSTASTIRGVRAGTESFRENGAHLRRGERLDAAEDLDEIDDLDDLDDEDFEEDEASLEEYEEIEADEDDDEDARESGIETIDDLDAAVNAAEDITNGDDNGSAFGRAEPRIKRTRRHNRE